MVMYNLYLNSLLFMYLYGEARFALEHSPGHVFTCAVQSVSEHPPLPSFSCYVYILMFNVYFKNHLFAYLQDDV